MIYLKMSYDRSGRRADAFGPRARPKTASIPASPLSQDALRNARDSKATAVPV
jgi:hypothetical protein